MNPFDRLHPALQFHIVNSLGWSSLRPQQLEAIEPILAGVHCLCLAPTAGGKTEAAIIPVLSRLLAEQWPGGPSVLYICPIKALLNNLEVRLARYAQLVGLRAAVWHGDISAGSKNRSLREPPHILLTTPESLEGMLVSMRLDSRSWFGQVRAVIADELHAIAGDDRGWHLRSLIARIERYADAPIQRIGLSATVGNPGELLSWFAPTGERRIVGSSTVTTDADVTVDFAGSIPNAALVVSRMHRGEKRLVFCDSRSGAESLASALRTLGVRTFVSHASLSRAERKAAETAFAEERDCVIVATSTLELGIDVGDLDRVIQIDSPSTVSSFLQRMGRTGRRPDSRRNCLFLCTSENALQLALGICRLWSERWVENVASPAQPWPLVAQQAMAMVLECGQLAQSELGERLQDSFPELDAADLRLELAHLIAAGYLQQDAGVLQVGPAMEHEYGRSHYRELLASFSSPPLLAGRHGSQDIGFIDPMVLHGEAPAIVLLGGRSWKVVSVDWQRRIAWLESVSEAGKALWFGTPRSLSFHVCQGIYRALHEAPPSEVRLSKRAQQVLEELSGAPSAGTVQTLGAGKVRLWTYAGRRANLAMTRASPELLSDRSMDDLSIELKPGATLEQRPTAEGCEPDIGDLEGFARSTKFAAAVPTVLLARTARAALLDAAGADAFARSGPAPAAQTNTLVCCPRGQ